MENQEDRKSLDHYECLDTKDKNKKSYLFKPLLIWFSVT